MLQALVEAVGTFFKNSKFLVAERHVVHHEQESHLVVRVLGGLDLPKHRLRLLKQDQCLLEAFLGDEVDRAFIELVDDDWDLVYKSQA